MQPPSGLERYLMVVWSLGPVERGFLVVSGVALLALAFVLFRSFGKRRVNLRAFFFQIEKLVRSDNLDRALRLSAVAPDIAICVLTRIGLEAGVYREEPEQASPAEAPDPDGGYRVAGGHVATPSELAR